MENIIKLMLILHLKSLEAEFYADYADYNEQNSPSYVGNDNHHYVEDEHTIEKPIAGDLTTRLNELSEHTMVTDSGVFPYMATVLKGTTYVSSGALIDEDWVLTTADGLFLLGESVRLLRVRLGSINYKKGGIVMPIKLIEIHPYFDDKMPNFDLALLMLARPVRYTQNLKSIRLQMVPRDVTATHFIVTSWAGALESKLQNNTGIQSMELIKRRRILAVTHLHPTDPEECADELKHFGARADPIMCLESGLKDPCIRDVGAPVVLNQILWGIISSWKPEDCDSGAGPVFANLVSATNVSTWIHATVHGHLWKTTTTRTTA